MPSSDRLRSFGRKLIGLAADAGSVALDTMVPNNLNGILWNRAGSSIGCGIRFSHMSHPTMKPVAARNHVSADGVPQRFSPFDDGVDKCSEPGDRQERSDDVDSGWTRRRGSWG